MTQLTIKELKEKISGGENFLLDLYATWCGPCRVMLSNLQNISESLENKSISTYKLDIDGGDGEDRDYLINELGIRSVPTIKIFKEGKQVFSRVGVMSGHEVLTQVENIING
jgi:thioredoxin 1